jgi:hypothetical protein
MVGQWSKIGLDDLKADGQQLYKVGQTTGKTSGYITATKAYELVMGSFEPPELNCGDRNGQVRWGSDSDFDDGDSGSVAYHPDPRENGDNNYLVASNCTAVLPGSADTSGNGYVTGVGAYRTLDQYGLIYGINGGEGGVDSH